VDCVQMTIQMFVAITHKFPEGIVQLLRKEIQDIGILIWVVRIVMEDIWLSLPYIDNRMLKNKPNKILYIVIAALVLAVVGLVAQNQMVLKCQNSPLNNTLLGNSGHAQKQPAQYY